MNLHRHNLRPPSARAFTLLELLLALAIIAVLSVAISTMVVGTSRADSFVSSQETMQSEVDLAMKRIVNNIRTSASAPVWNSASRQLQLTQPGVSGTIAYSVDSTGNLVESDPRYNVNNAPNTLVHGVGSGNFTCTITPPGPSQLSTTVSLDLLVPGSPPIERKMTIGCRGF